MSLIGALCYGSIFLYHEDLLLHIMHHPLWINLNKDWVKPIIIDHLL